MTMRDHIPEPALYAPRCDLPPVERPDDADERYDQRRDAEDRKSVV